MSINYFLFVGLLAVIVKIPVWLKERDEALLLKYPIPPMPSHGKLTTITHNKATIELVASPGQYPVESFASSFDMYYEAQLEDCDSEKNLVILSGTNGATFLYHEIIDHYHQLGYCTLNFDYRNHGRSSHVAGALTAELFGEDAAAIIKKVFEGRPVHLIGWSLGGALAYYLALNHPELVSSIACQGMASCFGKINVNDGNRCDQSFDFIKWFFSRDLMLRLLGTELQASAAVAAIKMQDNESTRAYYRWLKTNTMTSTPAVWGLWRGQYYQDNIHKISVPVLLLAGGHEHLIGFDQAALSEDVNRIGSLAEYEIFDGFSHFMFYEHVNGKDGLALSLNAIDNFHKKRFFSE